VQTPQSYMGRQLPLWDHTSVLGLPVICTCHPTQVNAPEMLVLD